MITYKEILKQPNRPKIGVVLSGGGMRCCAAIELFQFLEDAEIPIDILIGCSGGAMCACLRALEIPVVEMKEAIKKIINPKLFEAFNYRTMLGMLGFPFIQIDEHSSLIDTSAIKKGIKDFCKGVCLEDLPIKTLLQVTDIYTGKGAILSSGDLADAVYASSALAPLFSPMSLDNRLWGDGGFSSNLPILEAINHDIDIIIAVDFGEKVSSKPIGLAATYTNFIQRSLRSITALQNTLAIDLHHYEIIFIPINFDLAVSITNVTALPYIYAKGREVILSMQNNIISAIEQFPHYKNNCY